MKYKSKNVNADILKEYFDYSDGVLLWKKRTSNRVMVGDVAGVKQYRGYVTVRFFGKLYPRSRLVWCFHNGEIPASLQVDHINRVRDDDRIENLRLVSHRQNNQNKTRHSKHGIGVWFDKRYKKTPFFAQIKVNGKSVYLGAFSTKEEAQEAYNKACNIQI